MVDVHNSKAITHTHLHVQPEESGIYESALSTAWLLSGMILQAGERQNAINNCPNKQLT